MTKTKLSILLPSYNNRCYSLVAELKKQADMIASLEYEIIVADDGSRDQVCIIHNYLINELEHCRYIRRHENVGRSRIRNFLASEAKGDWLLFLDSDVSVKDNSFVAKYLQAFDDTHGVICGGTIVDDEGQHRYATNLRYRYERSEQRHHNISARLQNPYKSFRTTNFACYKETFGQIGFDERFTLYGYEDVMFGKMIKKHSIGIKHIDNPVRLNDFENNMQFLSKTEESLRTLNQFGYELNGYSTILDVSSELKKKHLRHLVWLWHKLFGRLEKKNLIGDNPSLFVYKLYKIGYFTIL